MLTVITFLNAFWLEILLVLAGISLFCISRIKVYICRPINISDNVPQDFEEFFHRHENDFVRMGWDCLGTFRITHPNQNHLIATRIFCPPDRCYAGALIRCQEPGVPPLDTIEFSSEFLPCGKIVTNNNPRPRSIRLDKGSFAFQFPRVGSVEILHGYHLDFCKAAASESFRLKKIEQKKVEDLIYDSILKELDYNIKRGLIKQVDQECYSNTLWGVFATVPQLVIYMIHSGLFKLYHPSRTLLTIRMRKKLAKIRRTSDQLIY